MPDTQAMFSSDPRERAAHLVDDIAVLAAGQADVHGEGERAVIEAALDGDPVPGAPTPKTGAPFNVVQRVKRQGAVVDALASIGVRRRDLIVRLVDLDTEVIDWCIDGADAGLSWPEIRQALAAEVGGPSELLEWTVPTEDRLYKRAKAKTDRRVSGPQPPLGFASPARRSKKTAQ